jgi:predicted alpha/beta-hydrolase family hydrolase
VADGEVALPRGDQPAVGERATRCSQRRCGQRAAGDGEELEGLPLVAGGRSSGARVACRTAEETGAVGVLCLAFPLVPPGRTGAEPRPSRLPELDAVTVPTLVVQGASDRFGVPPASPTRTVAVVPGDHSLRTGAGPAAVADAVRAWLGTIR